MSTYAVIMAGGGGTRLWPLSRRARPKPSLRLFGERTLFQLTVERLLPLLPPERILVVAVEEQAEVLRRQAPQLPPESFVHEPAPRGTAAVVGLAAVVLRRRDPQAVFACLPADHYLAHEDRFRELLQAAYALAQEGDLVTLGIRPTAPATGFGYIEAGAPRGEYGGWPAFRVRAFREKPALEEARRYVEGGRHSWNSGMFVWRAEALLAEIARQMPPLHAALAAIEAGLGGPDERAVLEAAWREIQPQTVDYGVMEGAQQVAVFPADALGWWDVGSWDALFEMRPLDGAGNLVQAPETLLHEVRDSLVFQTGESGRRLIAALGVHDLIVVDAGDVLLLCDRARAQEVRALVERLTETGGDAYL